MTAVDLIISADSHMLEPADLWTAGLPQRFRDRAPRIYIEEGTGRSMFGCPGIAPIPAAAVFGANVKPEDMAKHQDGDISYEESHRGGFDPAARLEDLAIDGMAADVLYTSLGFNLFWLDDAEFQQACFAVYNDWLAAFCSYAPDRFVGLGLVSCHDIGAAVEELTRCRNLGLKGAMIWCSPPDDRAFEGTFHDPLWAAAQEMDMPIHLHILTGQGKESRTIAGTTGNPLVEASTNAVEIMRSLAALMFGGVFERFPRLKVVSAENAVGWIPFFLQRADTMWTKHGMRYGTPLTMLPSECFRRNIWATFIDDTVGVKNAELIGVDRIMWSSDYPHTSSTWPHSLEAIERQFEGVAPDVKAKICRENVATLYGIDLEMLTPLPGTRTLVG